MAGTSHWLLLVAAVACYSILGTHAISIKDLPSHPEVNCNTPAVRAAFASCALPGATAACCKRLDDVFAEPSSQSYACLCFPQVLYKAAVKGADSGLDILGLLHKCRAKHARAFKTQWASADPTTCPAIPLNARTADMLTLMGPEKILPGTKDKPTWSFLNMGQFGEVNQQMADIKTVWDQIFGLNTVKLLLLVIINTAPLFMFMHAAVLSRFSPVYRSLSAADQLIACQHSVYAVMFSCSVIPQTALAFISLFKAWTGDYFAGSNLTTLFGLFLASRAMLYFAEACVRSVVKRSWLLIIHHQLFFLIVVMAVWTHNTAVLGIGVVLDLFACHEAPLYIALLAYRLRWNQTFTRIILQVACAWYILTRLFQTVLISYMIYAFAGMSAIRYAPEFILTALLFGAFTIIQAYTLVIYYAMYKKVCSRRNNTSQPQSQKQQQASSWQGARLEGMPSVTVEFTEA